MSSFLTRLERPKLWDGYTFLLSAIIGEIGGDIVFYAEGYNVAGTLLTTQSTTPDTYDEGVYNFNVNEIYGSFSGVSYLIVYLGTESGEELTDRLTIDIVTPCANPIYLIGRDSLGGVLQWLFDINQEYTFDYGNLRKAARKVLFATNLKSNQWDALQDFITLGEVYKENIVEFTSSTNRTSVRIGQQIYIVDTDGAKIGVVVIPTKNKTLTKRIKHIFEIEIEYPEVFTP